MGEKKERIIEKQQKKKKIRRQGRGEAEVGAGSRPMVLAATTTMEARSEVGGRGIEGGGVEDG